MFHSGQNFNTLTLLRSSVVARAICEKENSFLIKAISIGLSPLSNLRSEVCLE